MSVFFKAVTEVQALLAVNVPVPGVVVECRAQCGLVQPLNIILVRHLSHRGEEFETTNEFRICRPNPTCFMTGLFLPERILADLAAKLPDQFDVLEPVEGQWIAAFQVYFVEQWCDAAIGRWAD